MSTLVATNMSTEYDWPYDAGYLYKITVAVIVVL